MSAALYVTRACEGCGVEMRSVYITKRYCPSCIAQRRRGSAAAYQARHSADIRSPYPQPESPAERWKNAEARDAAFRADCRAADAAGLSYGKYMLLKQKQARPCANTDKPKG